jgi:hypothetical protein
MTYPHNYPKKIGVIHFLRSLCTGVAALAIPLGLLQFTAGCASARLTQFHNFAQAGTAYVKASHTVLDEAGTASIRTDSLIAVKGRDGLTTPKERSKFISDSNDLLRKRLLILDEIGRHGQLLQSYFETLDALADPQAPPTLGTAAQGVFESITKLSPTIKDASFGGIRVENAIPQATNFIVQSFKVKALENELKARSKEIERELALQEAAFKLISKNLETDLTAELEIRETEEVINPFATAKDLPREWVQHRQEILQARVAVQSAQSAASAAAELRESFVALVENRLSAPSITQLIADINSILDLTEKIEKASPPNT